MPVSNIQVWLIIDGSAANTESAVEGAWEQDNTGLMQGYSILNVAKQSDAAAIDALMNKLQLNGTPTLLFMEYLGASNYRSVARINGASTTSQILQVLKDIAAGKIVPGNGTGGGGGIIGEGVEQGDDGGNFGFLPFGFKGNIPNWLWWIGTIIGTKKSLDAESTWGKIGWGLLAGASAKNALKK